MLLLTPTQTAELLALIDQYHLVFMAGNLGADFLTEADLATLAAAGIDVAQLPSTGTLDEAFRFGLLSLALTQPQAQKMEYPQLRRFVSSGGAIPLTEQETAALRSIKLQAYHDIKGLGNKVSTTTGRILIEADQQQRHRYEKIIADTAERSLALRESASYLASEIGHATLDWSRDFDRISDFICHQAFDTGRAHQLLKQHGDGVRVYKSVYPQACKHCVRLLLTGGLGSEPRVFKLTELMANGSNVGRKVAEWKPVLGPQHPWCRCTLHECDPDHYEWDAKTQGFTRAKGEYKKRRQWTGATITQGGQTRTI